MSALFPKYHELICNTYTPDFTAGSTPCTLQQGNEVRSRLTAGGTFFRSTEVGNENNSIVVECIVTPGTGDEEDVVFNYTDASGVPQTPLVFTQEYDSVNIACISNGVTQLRSLLTGNAIVTTPAIDYGGTDSNATVPTWDASVDGSDCLLSSFGPSNMVGGIEPPAPSSALRTGPAYTLYFIPNSEAGTVDGIPIVVEKIVEWDSNNWVDYPSPLFAVDDPVTCP